MTTTKLRRGEYQITIGGRTLYLTQEICMDTNRKLEWNLYNENDEWMGSSKTKKLMMKSLKQADESKNYDF